MVTITRTLEPRRLIKRVDDQSGLPVEIGRNSPTLSLDFVNQKYKVPLSNFSRASTATRWDSRGTLVTSGVDELRQQFNPATGAYEGYLLEPSATNLNVHSELFTNWAETNTSGVGASSRYVEPNVALAPDGTMTASRVTASNDSDLQRMYKSIAATGDFVYSTFMKADSGSFGGIKFTTGDYFTVNLTTGEIIEAPSVQEHGVQDCGDGWYRLWIKDNGDDNSVIWVYISDGVSPNFIGAGESIFVWGNQVELGTEMTSYIKTTGGGTVTRAADVGLPPPYSRYEEKIFSDSITLTRASTGTYWDSTGTLQAAVNDEPRFEYNPKTDGPVGVLIERSKTNLEDNSEDPSTWILRENMTYNGSFVDRGMTFGEFIPSVGGGGNTLVTDAVYTIVTPSNTGPHSGSFVIKGNGISKVIVRRLSAATSEVYITVINLVTGQLEDFQGNQAGELTDLGEGYYLFQYPFTFNDTSPGGNQIAPLDGTDSDGVNSFFVAAMQYEEYEPSSLIPTSGATATRASDNVEIPIDLLPNFDITQGTIFIDFTLHDIDGDDSSGGPSIIYGLFGGNDSIDQERRYACIRKDNSTWLTQLYSDGVGVQASVTWAAAGTPLPGSRHRVAMTYEQGVKVGIGVNGVSSIVNSANVGTFETDTGILLGQTGRPSANARPNMTIHSFRCYDRSMDIQDLNALTLI